jgi:hypothetical protein
MGELLRLGLLIAACAAAVLALAGAGVAWLGETPRLMRAFRAGLDAKPDSTLIGHGSGRGVAFSLASGGIVTVWERGGWRLAYPLDELVGAEIDIDGEVAARVMRGETRRLLDRPGGAQREVRLRLIFDDPRHPDFELPLWPCRAGKGAPATPREAAVEANRWLARAEAVLRRTGAAALRPPRIAAETGPRGGEMSASAPAGFGDDADEEDALAD